MVWYKKKKFFKLPNKFENRMYLILDTENIKYERQYEVSGKYYDAYLPEYNTLLEFDGDYFHKQTYKECIYPIQKRNLKNDRKKNWIAENNGYKLIRIREGDYITSIKQLLEN
jgi:very-short-patch-repair endonuclease